MSKKTCSQFLGTVRQMIRAAGRRVEWEDPDHLARLVALRDEVDQAVIHAIAGQRRAGVHWDTIAEALGVSRPAVCQRWAKKVEAYQAEQDKGAA